MATPFDGFGAEAGADGGKARAGRPRAGRPRAGGGLRVLWLIIGLVVASAAAVYLYERVAVYRAKQRLEEIRQQGGGGRFEDLLERMAERERIYDRHPELRPR